MMKKTIFLIVGILFFAISPIASQEIEKFELPGPVAKELIRIEETYHVLDIASEKIWPGWNNYKDFPFLLEFKNGLRVLIGHPDPPQSFELLPGTKVADKNVYIDRSNITPLKLEGPLSCGGGILPYGEVDGKPVLIVSMMYYTLPPDRAKGSGQFKTEDQILIYIHELFHCFQKGIKGGYSPSLSSVEDPYYGEFKDTDAIMKTYIDSLKISSQSTYESNMKCYKYGCFQALLLRRLFPGWQQEISSEGRFLDEEIQRKAPLAEEKRAQTQKRFQEIYNLNEMQSRHKKAIDERDATYKLISSRKGKTYIISFKNISHYIATSVDAEKKSFRLGLINMYPDGIATIKVDDIELTVHQKPAEINQLYYVRLIDGDWKKRKEHYTMTYSSPLPSSH